MSNQKYILFNIREKKIISKPLNRREAIEMGKTVDPNHRFIQIQEHNE